MHLAADAALDVGAFWLLCGGLAYASMWPTSQIFGYKLVAGTDADEVALTFDDGPNDAATPELLDVLAQYGVRATFFVIGDFARQRPALVRRIVAEGHLLGNHSMSHLKLSITGAARVLHEMADCSALLEDITGEAVRYFRPPFGAHRPKVLRTARRLGMTTVMWNVTGYDWEPIGAERIFHNLERGIAKHRDRSQGSNLLLHDGGHREIGAMRMDTVRATERLLSAHAGTATRFVTVDAWENQSPNAN